MCWTLNNYTDEEVMIVNSLVATDKRFLYVCYGVEVGETGTPHLQGFWKTKEGMYLTGCKKVLPRAHFGVMRADNVSKAIDYCHKKGLPEEVDLVEFGKRPQGAGHRSDLDALHEALRSGATHQEVSNDHFGLSLRYSKGLSTWFNLNERTPVRSEPKIYWLWGPTGNGKSYRIQKALETKMEDVYCLSETTSGAWWDKYQGQTIVWMDDLRGAWMKMHMMLRILQSAPCQVSARGVGHWLMATTFFITTNASPQDLYEESDKLMRRVHDYAWVWEVTAHGARRDISPKRWPNEDGDVVVFSEEERT